MVLPAGSLISSGQRNGQRLAGTHPRSMASCSHWGLHPSWVSRCLFLTTKSRADNERRPCIRIAFADDGSYFWDRPSKVGQEALFPNGTQFRRGKGKGTSAFITHDRLKSRDFIKGDDVYILLTVEGMEIAWCYPSYLCHRCIYCGLADSTFRRIN